jgi:hypothetical protein
MDFYPLEEMSEINSSRKMENKKTDLCFKISFNVENRINI